MKHLIAIILFMASLPALAAAPSASMSASRTSGTAPLCVHFDATGSTDDSTANPFRDLSYLWNFGDSGAGTWTTGSGLTNKNIGAAPVAAHCYESAGSYTVALRVCDATACSTATQAITVTAADTTFATTATTCFYNSTVGTGCPAGATQTQSSDFDAALAACIGNTKRCLFKRGDTFTAGATTNIGTSVLLQIGAYGTGALPIIAGTNVTRFTFNNASGSDVRVMDLDVVGNGPTDTGMCANFTASVANTSFIGVTCRELGRGFSVQSGTGALNGFFLVGGSIHNYYASGGNAFFGSVVSGGFLGNSFGDVPAAYSGEHGLRIQYSNKVVVANNNFSGANAAKQHLTVRGGTHTAGAAWDDATDTRYVAITDNYFDASTTPNPWVLHLKPSGDTQCQWGRDILVERNYFKTGSNTGVAIVTSFTRVTKRNNILNATTSASLSSTSNSNDGTCSTDGTGPTNAPPDPDDIQVAYNTIYTTSATGSGYYPIVFGASGETTTNGNIKNNIIYSPNVTGTITIPLLQGTTTGTVSSNNSTDSSGSNQAKNTSPQFASGSPSSPRDFRVATGSYATNGGTAIFPGSLNDFYLCRDRTGDPRIGALVPSARAQCSGVAQ